MGPVREIGSAGLAVEWIGAIRIPSELGPPATRWNGGLSTALTMNLQADGRGLVLPVA